MNLSDIEKPAASTPPADLEAQIMLSAVPKNEREWWAHHEIEKLRDKLATAEGLIAFQQEQIGGMQRKVGELEADARRYRFLRGDVPPYSERWPRWEVKHWGGKWWDEMRGPALDVAIDAALNTETTG